LSQFKKYQPSANLKFNYSGTFQSLKLRIIKQNILQISLKLNFTRNTLGRYGFNIRRFVLAKEIMGLAYPSNCLCQVVGERRHGEVRPCPCSSCVLRLLAARRTLRLRLALPRAQNAARAARRQQARQPRVHLVLIALLPAESDTELQKVSDRTSDALPHPDRSTHTPARSLALESTSQLAQKTDIFIMKLHIHKKRVLLRQQN